MQTIRRSNSQSKLLTRRFWVAIDAVIAALSPRSADLFVGNVAADL